MWWYIIPTFTLLGSLGIFGFILASKIPQLRVLNVESIPEERTKRIKEQIILQRFDRVGREKIAGVAKTAVGTVGTVSRVGRRAVQKLYKLEQYYQRVKRAAEEGSRAMDTGAVQRLLDEAEAFVRDDEMIQAEKRYIEIISHHPKHVKAYEGLGNLYLQNRQYDQARETLQFTLRLSPEDPSVRLSLAELEEKAGDLRAAVEHLRAAVDLRPNNPKFIDLYTEAAFGAKLSEDAKKGIDKLKEANPENQKIPEFEERYNALTGNSSQPAEPLV
jgi:tetratricopeptide (TPR) repeat protein